MDNSFKLKKILVTGKSSRFCKYLKKDLEKFNCIYTSKKEFDILNFDKMKNFIKNKKISHIIHIAGLSRPMSIHEKDINKSIDLNIIGTANIVKISKLFKIKLIYFSTNYVYPGTKGNYGENDSVYPINNYAWSKLGGEASVQLYKNSLILRMCMMDFPFVHNKAITGAQSSFIYNKTVSKIIPFLLDKKGIINIGGKKRDILDFAKKFGQKKIRSISWRNVKNFPKDSSIKINKLKKILNKNKKLRNIEL